MSKIIIDGIERDINTKEIERLTDKYLVKEPDDLKTEFYNEVIFRIEELDLDSSLLNGKSAEEYYFAACLAYAEENGFVKFFEEEDDSIIFDYCGSELE